MSSRFFAPIHAHRAALRRLSSIVIAACAGMFSTAALAAAPLTLGHAQQLAQFQSRQLSAQDMATNAARDMAVAAGQLPDPVLRFGIDNLPLSGADKFSLGGDFMTMRRIGIGQELTRSDKRQLRAERYEREADKSAAAKSAASASIDRDTALAWLDRYYAEQMASIVAEQMVQEKTEIDAADSAYRGGRGNRADILAARSALAMVEDRTSELDRRVRNARTMLARWIGAAADAPLAGTPAIDTLRIDPARIDAQLAHHPQIAVLTKQEDIARVEAKLAEANKRPDWSVEAAFQQRGPGYSNMLSVGVTVPLQWDQKHRQDRELAAKLAAVEQAKAERDDMLRAHTAEVTTMVNEWENDRARTVRYETTLLPLAGERTAATLAAYRGGKASLSDVLTARRNEIDVRLQALQLRWDTARLWAQLDFLFPASPQDAHAAQQKDPR